MLRRVLGESVRVSISGCDDPALIDFEPTQFETMICQIASNARDVMPSGGAFEVFVEKINTTPESADPRERNNPRAGQQVQLRFVDNGLGMTDEVMRRLFEPFFTTKPAGRGLGLGLATIQNAVTRFGGSIEISSTLGRGTEVRVQLPLVNPSSDLQSRQVDTGRQSPRGETRNATILICETDPSIAESAHRTLAELGYSVRITNTGREALAEARQTSNRIDLLITETALPDMGGRQLADLARRLRPDLQVLFLSSSGDGPLTDSGYIEIGVNTLVKPFPPRELIDNVRAALGNHIVNGPINS